MNRYSTNARLCFVFIFFFHFHLLFPSNSSVAQLSLEEKVGQLLMVHFHGEEANEEARRFIQELHVGGIIYYNWGNGLHRPLQVARLSQGLQRMAQVPLLLAVDQEGGAVNRLKEGFTRFPSNYALGLTGEYQWGKACARMIGQELKAVGISLNLAPVVDVYTNPANPVIGIRAFSSDPLKVSAWASAFLQGYQEAGIAAALKHFPGHGDATVDSHEALPIISKSRDQLELCELLPFRSLAAQADVILTAHLMFPALDPVDCTTFSKKIVTDVLRKQLNFQGVVMTDSLAMEGILSQCSSLEEAVLRSFEAGHDMILLGGKQLLATQNGLEFSFEEVKRVCLAFIEAVKSGRIPENKVDEAVARILALKQKTGLFEAGGMEISSLESQVGTFEHKAFALQLARHALRLNKGESSLPLQAPILAIAPDFLKEDLEQTSWGNLGNKGKLLYFHAHQLDSEALQVLNKEIGVASHCIFFAYRTWRSPEQKKLFSTIRKGVSSVATIILSDPIDEELLLSSDVLLSTYGAVPCQLQVAHDFLFETE